MEKIVVISRPEYIQEFLDMEDGVYKNILYNRLHRDFIESDLIKTDDGKIHFASNTYTIKRGKKYYAKLKSKRGFTVNEKGKLKVWYGSTITDVSFCTALEALNIDWFKNDSKSLWPFITKTLFEKVITGKITNPIDYLRAYLKLARLDASPKLLYDVCKSRFLTKSVFLRYAYQAKDVNHYLEYLLDDKASQESPLHIVEDIITQASVLNRKIDFKWSRRRMNEEHIIWSKEIMEVEALNIPDRSVSVNLYEILSPYLPDLFEPLDTQKKVFMEGTKMQHCVYTNYWPTIDSGRYLAFHINYKGEEATLGLYVEHNNSKKKLTYNQLYSKRNSPVSQNLHIEVNDALEKLNDDINRMGISLRKEISDADYVELF